jgi:hypothetical protein
MLQKDLPQHSARLKQPLKPASPPLKRSKTSASNGSITTSCVSDEVESIDIDDTTLHEDSAVNGDDQDSTKDDSEPEVDEEATLGMFHACYLIFEQGNSSFTSFGNLSVVS